jgi:nitroreductase
VDAIDVLLGRNSAPRLNGNVGESQIRTILEAGFRAPDHAMLKPWRILLVEGDAREQLGALFARAKLARDPDQTPEQLARIQGKTLRAPLIIVVAARVVAHPKVPEVEQLLSAGAVAHGMLLASHALGLGAMWRTGEMAYDAVVHEGLGLNDGEKIVGFLYVGEIEGKTKSIPIVNVAEMVTRWGH